MVYLFRCQVNRQCFRRRLDSCNRVQPHDGTCIFVQQPGDREAGHAAPLLCRQSFHSVHYLLVLSPLEPFLGFLVLLSTFCLLREWPCEKTSCNRTPWDQAYALCIAEQVHLSLLLAVQQIVQT